MNKTFEPGVIYMFFIVIDFYTWITVLVISIVIRETKEFVQKNIGIALPRRSLFLFLYV